MSAEASESYEQPLPMTFKEGRSGFSKVRFEPHLNLVKNGDCNLAFKQLFSWCALFPGSHPSAAVRENLMMKGKAVYVPSSQRAPVTLSGQGLHVNPPLIG